MNEGFVLVHMHIESEKDNSGRQTAVDKSGYLVLLSKF